MAEVYSYMRYSSKGKQSHGDSTRRQIERGEAWIKRENHSLAEAFADHGVSGFRGRNRHKGALGDFLNKVRNGLVKPESILLVENLDRLSRQEMDEAQSLFVEIIQAGVSIAVLTPTERIYNRETIKSPFALMEPLLAFYLAHLESQKKADRLREVWNAKRKNGGRFNVKVPSWIDRVDPAKLKDKDGNQKSHHNPHAEKFRLNEGQHAIRYIFTRTAEGVGQRRLLGELVAKFKPIGMSGQWNTSFLNKVLNDRSVLGEYQPRERGDDDKRVKVGSVIVDYWPRVVEEELWLRTQAAKSKRKKMKGPNSKFVNIFVGLLFNAHDGSAVHTQATRGTNKVKQRRLVSYNHLRRIPNADPLSVPYDTFKEVCLHYLHGLKVEEVEVNIDTSALRAKEQELSGIQVRIGEIEAAMSSPDEDFATLRNVLRTARSTEKRLVTEVEELRSNIASSASPLRQLQEMTEDDKNANVERLRLLVHELVARIELKPEKHYGRVWCSCVVTFRNGFQRLFVFGPHRMTYQENFEMTLRKYGVPSAKDWNDPKFYILADIAKEHSKPADVPCVNEVPNNIGDAAKLFLNVRRSEMTSASFRVVPSKVERFVSYLGDDLPCRNINRVRWNRWMAWLETEVKESRLAEGTARVSWQRAREFVRWLVEHEVCTSFGL